MNLKCRNLHGFVPQIPLRPHLRAISVARVIGDLGAAFAALRSNGSRMPAPAANSDATVTGVDLHTVVMPAAPPVLLPHPFTAVPRTGLATTVLIGGRPAVMQGTGCQMTPPHLPTPPGTSFVVPPTSTGTVTEGSATVFIEGSPAARAGDGVATCSEGPQPAARLMATGSVIIG